MELDNKIKEVMNMENLIGRQVIITIEWHVEVESALLSGELASVMEKMRETGFPGIKSIVVKEEN